MIQTPKGAGFGTFLGNEARNLGRLGMAAGADAIYNIGALSERARDTDYQMRLKEDEILVKAPDSYEAFQIRKKRGIPHPTTSAVAPSPVNTPSNFAAPVGGVGARLNWDQ